MKSPEKPINLVEEAASLDELWSPRVLLAMNGQYLKVARVQGEFPWHAHAAEDELFLVLRGTLRIGRAAEDGGPITLHAGEAFTVARGVRHNTSAEGETLIALLEPATTEHTGEERTAMTRSIAEQLGAERPGSAQLGASEAQVLVGWERLLNERG